MAKPTEITTDAPTLFELPVPEAPPLSGAVHPFADRFPMRTDAELDELAADIKANGQQTPIVVDADGVLIDGRNRLEACRRAEVEPTRTLLPNGENPIPYILRANIARRHLSKGQQAILAAESIFTESVKWGSQTEVARIAGVSISHVNNALAILTYASDQVAGVLNSTVTFDAAYAAAQTNKAAQRNHEKRARQALADLARLRVEAPDLADLVEREELPLPDAIAAHNDRLAREQARRARVSHEFYTATTTLAALLTNRPDGMPGFAAELMPEANPFRDLPEVAPAWNVEGLDALITQLRALRDALRHQEKERTNP